ncbi:unnamed protein product [Closterium sp. NIES-54]
MGRAGCAVAVAAAPPPRASAVTVPPPTAALVAPPLPSPAATTAASAAATKTPVLLSPAASVTTPVAVGGTPALPSPGAAVTPPLLSPTATAPAATLVTPPLLSPAAAATAPATAGGTFALPSPGVAVTPSLLSPAATATAPAAALVTPPLLSPAAAATAPAAATMTPPLLSPAATVAPPLLSPAAATETTPAAAVPSQTTHAPPSPTGGDAAHGTLVARNGGGCTGGSLSCCWFAGGSLCYCWLWWGQLTLLLVLLRQPKLLLDRWGCWTGGATGAFLAVAGTASTVLAAAGTASTVLADSGTASTVLAAVGTASTVLAAAGTASTVLAAAGTSSTVLAAVGTASTVLAAAGAACTVLAAAGAARTVLSGMGQLFPGEAMGFRSGGGGFLGLLSFGGHPPDVHASGLPEQNGIAERRIGMVMDVARTSMIHAAAPYFLWPFAVQFAVHHINLQPRVSLPETTPTLRWTGKVGDASAFRVWGSRAFVDPAELVEVAVDSVAARGAEPAGEGTGGAETGGADSGGAESGLAEPGGAGPEGTMSGGAEPARAESRGALGVPSRREPLSPQRLREWYSRRCRGAAGAGGAPGAPGGAAGAGAAGGAAGAGATGGAAGAGAAGGATGAGGAAGATGGAGTTGGAAGAGAAEGAADAGAARAAGAAGATGGAGAAGGATGAGGAAGATGGAGAAGGTAGAGAAGGAAGTGDPGAKGTGSVSAVSGGAARPRPYYPASPLPGPSPYTGPTRGLTERREPESRPVLPVSRSASPVRTVGAGRVSRPRLPPVPGTHSMTLRPSTAPQRVPLPSPPASSLPDGPDPESDSLRAARPPVTRFLATAVTDPLFESTDASALVTELVDFVAACRLDYATSLVADSVSVYPPSVGGECALGTDVLEDRQEEFECFTASVPHLLSMLLAFEGDPDAPDIPTPLSYAEAIEGPYSSQWQTAMDAEMASWNSTSTYVNEVPPPGANIVSGMWIFRVKRASGSPPVFKARYVARGFNDLVFATADTEALAHVKSELQKRHTCTDLGELTSYLGLRITRDRAQRTITLTQSHMVQQVLQRFGFTYSSPQSTSLPTGHSLSAPPSDESVEPSGPYPELVGCLMYLMTCTRPDLAYPLGLLARYVAPGRARVVLTGPADASWVDDLATQQSSLGYTFCLGSGSVSWQSTRSSSILSSSCEAEIYAGAMAAQELRWLTYLLTDLGEAPRSPPVLYVDNKAMLALCQEHRLEHRTKHIALRYFLARKLQQRGQFRLAYVASQANTADVFTNALQPCDHQRFCTAQALYLLCLTC